MTPYKLCYLNGIQSADLANEPAFGVRNPHIPHHRPLDKVYNFNPYDGLTAEEQQYILGIQACVWTEHIKEFNHLTYMLLPRLSALAETAWSLPRKNWERYIANLENLRRFYEAYNYNYALSYWRDKANGIE
jgi:hexosaminidase